MGMPQGQALDREALLRRVGDMSQLAGITPVRLAEGPEEGTLALLVRTGGGLEYTVLPSRGMDIGAATLNGLPLAWISPAGFAHPAHYDPQGLGWLKTFGGGLLTTCGLSWMGAPGMDGDAALGLHGRASHLPARNVAWRAEWEGDVYALTATGVVTEAHLFGPHLRLTRTLRAELGKNAIHVQDRVENAGFEPQPLMLLYHINLGWPVVSEHSYLVLDSAEVEPRDEVAAAGLERHTRFEAPTPGFREQVYFHTLRVDPSGWATASIRNPEADLQVAISYRPDQLPHFVQWKMMGEGAYVCGLEPATARVLGRAAEREAGRLQMIAPGELREFEVRIAAGRQG